MRAIFYSICLFIFSSVLALAQTNDVKTAKLSDLDKVEINAHILRVNNVSPRDGAFDVDMWLTFSWKNDEIKPYETFEVVNGTVLSSIPSTVIKNGDRNLVNVRVRATIYHDFDVSRFPLDNHHLTIEIEDRDRDEFKLLYVAGSHSALDELGVVNGWDIDLDPLVAQEHVYAEARLDSGMKSPDVQFMRLIIPLELKRTSLAPLFKSFWTLFLAVLIGLLAFHVNVIDLDARFGLGMGAVFAASANAFIVQDGLPKTTVLTLAEQINMLAVGTIFISIFMSVISLHLYHSGKASTSRRMDKIAFWIVLGCFLFGNIALFKPELGF